MFRLRIFLGKKKKKKLRLWKATARSACGSPLLFPHFGKQWLIQITSWTSVGSLHDKIISYFVGSFYVEKHLKYISTVMKAKSILLWGTVENWKKKACSLCFLSSYKAFIKTEENHNSYRCPCETPTDIQSVKTDHCRMWDTLECIFFKINSSWM